jgi:hypothetical protein
MKQKNSWMRKGSWITLLAFAIFFILMVTEPSFTTNPETSEKTPGNWMKVIWITLTIIFGGAYIWLSVHAPRKD